MARRRRGAIAARNKHATVSEVPTPKDQPVLGSVIGEKQQRITAHASMAFIGKICVVCSMSLAERRTR